MKKTLFDLKTTFGNIVNIGQDDSLEYGKYLIIIGILLGFVSTQKIGYWDKDVFFILLIIGFVLMIAIALLLWPLYSVFYIFGYDKSIYNIINEVALGNKYAILSNYAKAVESLFNTVGLSHTNFFIAIIIIGIYIGIKTPRATASQDINKGLSMVIGYLKVFLTPLIFFSLLIAIMIALFQKGQIGFINLLINYINYLIIIVLIPYSITAIVAGVICGIVITVVRKLR